MNKTKTVPTKSDELRMEIEWLAWRTLIHDAGQRSEKAPRSAAKRSTCSITFAIAASGTSGRRPVAGKTGADVRSYHQADILNAPTQCADECPLLEVMRTWRGPDTISA